jgi:predicted ArsR family transcriptional regulator
MAEQVGREYGATMAAGLTGNDLASGQRSLRSALQSVADALTAHGFAAHTDQRNNQLRIVNNHCPFGDVAIEHPVICAVDRGMVKGMLTALYGGDTSPSLQESLPHGDTFCATAV